MGGNLRSATQPRRRKVRLTGVFDSLQASPPEREELIVEDGLAGKQNARNGSALVARLASELKNEAGSVRRAAAEALAEIRDPRAVRLLLAALGDRDPSVRVAVVYSLTKAAGSPSVASFLCRLLNDPAVGVRLAAAEALTMSRDPALETAFLKLLEDEHFEVRVLAVQFLVRTRNPHHVPALVRALHDSDHDVREAAAWALGELKTDAAIEGLVLALADQEFNVRTVAEKSLNKIDPNWADSEAARRAGEQLEALLEDRPAWVRGPVARLLTRILDSPIS